jgi:hypothetical protein
MQKLLCVASVMALTGAGSHLGCAASVGSSSFSETAAGSGPNSSAQAANSSGVNVGSSMAPLSLATTIAGIQGFVFGAVRTSGPGPAQAVSAGGVFSFAGLPASPNVP